MSGTSIGFGGGEVIEVGLSLERVLELVQKSLRRPSLIEFEDMASGEVLIVNPLQIKVLQPLASGSGDR